MLRWILVILSFLGQTFLTTASDEAKGDKNVIVDCSTLRLGQFICPDPSFNHIDLDTQQLRGCTKGTIVPSEGEADGI